MLCRGSCNLDRCLDVGIVRGLVTEAAKAAGTFLSGGQNWNVVWFLRLDWQP